MTTGACWLIRRGRLIVIAAMLICGSGSAAAQQSDGGCSSTTGAASPEHKVEQLQQTVLELQAEIAELRVQMKEMSTAMAVSSGRSGAPRFAPIQYRSQGPLVLLMKPCHVKFEGGLR